MVTGHSAAPAAKRKIIQVSIKVEIRKAAEFAWQGSLAKSSPPRAPNPANSHRTDPFGQSSLSEICEQIHPSSSVSSKHQGAFRAWFPINLGDYAHEERFVVPWGPSCPRKPRSFRSRTQFLGNLLFWVFQQSFASAKRNNERGETQADSGEQRRSWACSHFGKEQGANGRHQFGT